MNANKIAPFHPTIFQDIKGLLAAQSTRHGGLSTAPYSSLNLGANTADKAENIWKNRNRFAEALGIDWKNIASTKQVHRADILFVKEAKAYSGYDALVTDIPNIFLAIGTVDCAGVLIFDKKNRVSAAVHAGWRGAALHIVLKTLQFMKEHCGTAAADTTAYISPCIGKSVFEVGAEVAEQFDAHFSKKTEKEGKYLLDLKAIVAQQLHTFGLSDRQIEVDTNCTYSNTADYFSYRKEGGNTGRMLSIIGIKA